jgi:hypothetical protein
VKTLHSGSAVAAAASEREHLRIFGQRNLINPEIYAEIAFEASSSRWAAPRYQKLAPPPHSLCHSQGKIGGHHEAEGCPRTLPEMARITAANLWLSRRRS